MGCYTRSYLSEPPRESFMTIHSFLLSFQMVRYTSLESTIMIISLWPLNFFKTTYLFLHRLQELYDGMSNEGPGATAHTIEPEGSALAEVNPLLQRSVCFQSQTFSLQQFSSFLRFILLLQISVRLPKNFAVIHHSGLGVIWTLLFAALCISSGWPESL